MEEQCRVGTRDVERQSHIHGRVVLLPKLERFKEECKGLIHENIHVFASRLPIRPGDKAAAVKFLWWCAKVVGIWLTKLLKRSAYRFIAMGTHVWIFEATKEECASIGPRFEKGACRGLRAGVCVTTGGVASTSVTRSDCVSR